jgi:GABA(A) receptor-associated protein
MNNKTFEERLMYSSTLKNKYQDRIPVIIEKSKESDPEIDKNKYLVPKSLKINEFICIIKKRIKIDSKKAIFIFINNKLIPMGASIEEVYETEKNDDGFLYIKYTLENTFG